MGLTAEGKVLSGFNKVKQCRLPERRINSKVGQQDKHTSGNTIHRDVQLSEGDRQQYKYLLAAINIRWALRKWLLLVNTPYLAILTMQRCGINAWMMQRALFCAYII